MWDFTWLVFLFFHLTFTPWFTKAACPLIWLADCVDATLLPHNNIRRCTWGIMLYCVLLYVLWNYRRVPLKPDSLGAWKSVRLKHYPAYPITIIILIIQRNLATKIRAKWESSLTAVRLKQGPTCMYKLSKHFKLFHKFTTYGLFSTLQALYTIL